MAGLEPSGVYRGYAKYDESFVLREYVVKLGYRLTPEEIEKMTALVLYKELLSGSSLEQAILYPGLKDSNRGLILMDCETYGVDGLFVILNSSSPEMKRLGDYLVWHAGEWAGQLGLK